MKETYSIFDPSELPGESRESFECAVAFHEFHGGKSDDEVDMMKESTLDIEWDHISSLTQFHSSSLSSHSYHKDKDSKEEVYDPAFWLPALLQALTHEEIIPVREIANSGLIGVVLAALSSVCPLIRVYARACLSIVLGACKSKAAERDVSFRERPQFIQLLHFVCNSITSNSFESDAGLLKCPRISTSTSVFLGRASLHLFVPSHELYSKINKYLLAKPFLDEKDVPLFDLTILHGDVFLETAEVISVMRMIRDGLLTRTDHLNLCRKNAYMHLMTRFSILMRDVRLVHASLDIFNKALGIPSGGRYLLERCGLVTWLAHQISISALCSDYCIAKTNAQQSELVLLQNGGDLNQRGKGEVSLPSIARVFGRLLHLLRKTVYVDYLLSLEGEVLKDHYRQFSAYLRVFMNDCVHLLDFKLEFVLGIDSIRIFLDLLWDCSIVNLVSGRWCTYGAEGVIGLAKLIRLKANGSIDHEYLVLQTLCSLALFPPKHIMGPSSIICDGIDALQSAVLKVVLSLPEPFMGQLCFLQWKKKVDRDGGGAHAVGGKERRLPEMLRMLEFVGDNASPAQRWAEVAMSCFDGSVSMSAMGTVPVLVIVVATLERLLCALESSCLADKQGGRSDSLIRLLLLLHNVYERSSPSSSDHSLLRTLLSSIDHQDISRYDLEFISFQFNLRCFTLGAYLYLNGQGLNADTSTMRVTRGKYKKTSLKLITKDVQITLLKAFRKLLLLPERYRT